MLQDQLFTIPLNDSKELRLVSHLFSVLADHNDDEEDEATDNKVDMDRLLRIDVAHLEAEIVTFPVILNLLGLCLAEVENKHALAKMNLEIYEAKQREKIREDHLDKFDEEEVDEDDDNKRRKKTRTRKALTLDEVESRLLQDSVYKIKRKSLIDTQRQVSIMTSLYWTAKSKDSKLDKLSMTLKAGDVYETLASSKLKRINMVELKDIKPLKER